MELTPEDMAGLSAAEIEALTATDADTQLGLTGDTEAKPAVVEPTLEETEEADAAEPAAEEAKADEPAEAAATEDEPKADAETPAEEAKPEVRAEVPRDPQLPRFRVDGPKDYKAERSAIRALRTATQAEFDEGKLSDAEYHTKIGEYEDQLDDLLIQATRAQTLQEVNTQTAESQLMAAVNAVLASAKADGTMDYKADTKAAQQFDQFLNLVAGDPDNAGKSAAEITLAAHKAVLALRGITGTPAAAVPAPAPAAVAPKEPAKPREVPKTLAGLPSAAPSEIGNDVMDTFKNLDGEEAEDFLARLPQSQQDALLRSADALSFQHRR